MTEPSSTPPPEHAPEPPVPASRVLPLMRLLPPPPDGTILVPPEPSEQPRRGWFFAQIWAEMSLAAQMYFDPRYRVSRTAQIAFPLFAVLLVLNYFFFAVWFSLAVVSPVAERLIDVTLAVLAYRVLVRELDRYRAVLDYLARYAPK
ncbi:hypothetical protein [Frigoriglobus tundricola]|uniref:Uncharacterized protein n=1 Tax=Frigoriglobus tundricola TaxID=2774151 RepID=A0A6M5YZ71_9BACT|nr:hypothetical protein [Frigoriglobus tundricola]QJW98212.1 hypothetical protein FTUN_5793 [Frigoriglobus tundricola]